MNLAKISLNGQITLPVDIRRKLGVKSGDKVLFVQKENGEIVVKNAASFQPISKQQFLEELETARKQVENGQVLDAKEALNRLRDKYGL